MVDSLDSKKVIGGALGRHIRIFQLLCGDWRKRLGVGGGASIVTSRELKVR